MGELINLYTDISTMGLILITIFIMIILAALKRVAFVFMQTDIKNVNKYEMLFWCVGGVIFSVLMIFGYCNMGNYLDKAARLNNELKASDSMEIYGLIYDVKEKEKSIYIYVSEAYIKLSDKREIKADKILLIKYLNEFEKSENMTEIQAGKYISAKGEYGEFEEVRNEGGFDEEKYYYSIGIVLKVTISDYLIEEGVSIIEKIQNKLFIIKNKLMDRLDEIASEKYSGIYKGILLGDKSYIDDETLNLYKVSGISHILSISGLHISLIVYFIYKQLRKYRGYLVSGVLAFGLIYLYAIMIGAGFSTKRAVIMFAISILGNFIGRSYDLLSALFFAGIIIVIDNPMAIYNTGMLLSFVAILGIDPMDKLIAKILESKNKFVNTFMTSISINAMTMPILINSYNEISMYSPVVNVLILGVSGQMVGFGFIGMLAGLININLGKIFIFPGCFILKIYEFICEKVSRLDGAVKIVSHRSIERICVYYFVLACILGVYFILIKKNYFGKIFLKRIRYCLVLVFFWILFILLVYSDDSKTVVKMIDVGQGDSIFIQDEGINILVDAGSSSKNGLMDYTLIPFLKYNGVESLDYLILTHSDSDHGGSFTELLSYKINGKNMVENLVLPDISDSLKDELYREIEGLAKKEKINIIYFSRGMSLSYSDSTIECIWPIKQDGSMDKNSLSIVFEYRKNDFSMLFTGDLTKEGEKEIIDLQGNQKMDIDVLKVAHHGSKDSSTSDFLKLLKPELSLISCGEDNSYGHPHKDTLDRLESCGSKVVITEESGEIIIEVGDKVMEWNRLK